MKKLFTFCLFISLFLFSTFLSAAQDARYYLKQASKYYNQEDYRNAEKAFQKLLKMDVALHEDFYYFYGKTLFYNGRYKKAVANLGNFTSVVGNKSKYYADASQLLKRAQKKVAAQEPKKNTKKKKILKLSTTPEMITIPAGAFIMGSSHGTEDQKPPHRMTIDKKFSIGKYEVTFAQYDVFAKETNRRMPDDYGWGRGNRPVINVSLNDAHAYTRWLSEKTNRKFRLPTEAEWEYIARTGIKTQLGFNDLLGLGDANCDGCRYFWESAQTVPVGNFEPNKYGVYDLFGNVWEWTCSLYTRRYNGQEQYCADENDLTGKTMSVRGGSWDSANRLLRSYVRYNNFHTYMSNELGFRVLEEL